MFYIRLHNGIPVEVSDERPSTPCVWAGDPDSGRGWMSSRDLTSLEHAVYMADSLITLTGEIYLGADESASVSPRFRVIKAPKIGDAVSKRFNGDSYPCGYITKITPTWIVTTDTGAKFRRFKQTGGWREQGRGFWMTGGHIDERNPSF